MIRLASGENFDGDIVRGLLRRVPELDLVRVQDADLAGSPDPVFWPGRQVKSEFF